MKKLSSFLAAREGGTEGDLLLTDVNIIRREKKKGKKGTGEWGKGRKIVLVAGRREREKRGRYQSRTSEKGKKKEGCIIGTQRECEGSSGAGHRSHRRNKETLEILIIVQGKEREGKSTGPKN